MKKTLILAFTAMAMLAGSVDATAAPSYKRGVGVNNFSQEMMALLAPGISWYYNWGGSHGTDPVEGVDYVPMGWKDINEDQVRNYVKKHPNVKYLLGMNEPNFTDQANLTPQEAAERWPRYVALAKELNLKLVGPAMNFSTGTYASPQKWMDEFVALVGLDSFDFTCIHNYGGLGVMKTFAQSFHDKYGKPVWVTEWCNWPGGAGNNYVSPANQIASMIECVHWLEQTDYIYRYAWFMATGDWDNKPNRPNYGLLGVGGTIAAPAYFLTPQGHVYTYMGTFDKSAYNAENTWVNAADCNDMNAVTFGQSDCPLASVPLSITSFTASGGWAEFNYEVKTAGNKFFTMSIAGMGEPTRFDPTFTITATHEDGTVVTLADKDKFSLPNDDHAWVKREYTGSLKAGKWTVRVADMGRSNGMILGAVCLSESSGIATISAAEANEIVDVYSFTGAKLRSSVRAAEATEGLPAGFYIVGNRKVLVK